MDLETIDFNTERSEDCVLVDTKHWIKDGSALERHRLSGRAVITYITKVLNENAVTCSLQGAVHKNDTVLLTRVASEVATDRAFALEEEDRRYYQVPILQVVGTFQNDTVSYSSLNLLFNRVLIKKVEPSYNTFIVSPNDNTMIGEVVKVGKGCLDKEFKLVPYKVKVGDIVLVRDNVSTEIFLDGQTYYAVEESMLVGKFNSKPYTIDTLEVMNKSILMLEHIPTKALNSKLLTPSLVYEDLDITDVYNRNLFKIEAVDPDLTLLSKNDILLVLRDITNYVYFNLEKYFIISGMGFVEAKVKE